jgi:phosphate transport system substrate-binding protein
VPLKLVSTLSAGIITVAIFAASLIGCGSPGGMLINGAGATFPYPIYAKWFDEFHKLHPDIQINYQSIGSGGGIRQLLTGTVDFGASDSPMTDEQLRQAKTGILHFPTVLGAVVCSYNVPRIQQELNFTPEILTGIQLGKITKWSDTKLARVNPAVSLPAENIVPIHRADGSGTTFVWTEYLSKVSPEWKQRVGAGTSVSWPAGLGAKGNEGVAGLIKQTPYSIGYLELVYAIQNNMPQGKVRNSSGILAKADLRSVTAAAATAIPDDFRVSLTDSPGRDAYPIASFTWLLVPNRIADAEKKASIIRFLHWMLTDGQEIAESLSYAPLPQAVISKEREAILQVQ